MEAGISRPTVAAHLAAMEIAHANESLSPGLSPGRKLSRMSACAWTVRDQEKRSTCARHQHGAPSRL